MGNVKKVIPDIRGLLTDLTDESDRVEALGRQVTGNIAALRDKIDIARNQANRVGGMMGNFFKICFFQFLLKSSTVSMGRF